MIQEPTPRDIYNLLKEIESRIQKLEKKIDVAMKSGHQPDSGKD